MHFLRPHLTRLRTNNLSERIFKEVRRRPKTVGSSPDGESALMLVAARLRYVAGTRSGTRRYMDMEPLREQMQEQELAHV